MSRPKRPNADNLIMSLAATPTPSPDADARARGRNFKRQRSLELDGQQIMNINFRLERNRAAKLKAHCVEVDLTQEEFFDELLRQAGF